MLYFWGIHNINQALKLLTSTTQWQYPAGEGMQLKPESENNIVNLRLTMFDDFNESNLLHSLCQIL